MRNVIFAYPDRVLGSALVTTVLENGSWQESGGVSLDNLLDPDLSSLARSADLLAASTMVDIDLGTVRDILVIGVLGSNASYEATVRFRAYSDAGRTVLVHDTGVLDFQLPFYPPGTVPWGNPALWDGKICDEDRDGYRFDFIRALDAVVVARYWRVEFSDPGNADGYFELSRLILAPGWQPPYGFSYGAQFGWQTLTDVDTSLGGKRFYNERSKRRFANITLEDQSAGMAAASVMEMQRRLGLSGELLFVFNPDDASQAEWQRSFLCTMEELSPLEFAYFNANTAAFKLLEVL